MSNLPTPLNNTPAVFTFNNSTPVRVQMQGETPWFCLNDCCGVLEIKHPQNFLSSANCSEDGVWKTNLIDSIGREQETTFINERNLYALVMRSNKPEAKQFQDWLFGDVLPEIRKTGKYGGAPMGISADPILLLLDQAKSNYLKTLEHDDRITKLEQSQAQARESLLALPAPESEAPELTPRKRCVQGVEKIAELSGMAMQECWTRVYRSYDLRYSTNLTRLVGTKPKMQYLEEHGRIEQLYGVIVAEVEKLKRIA